MKKFINKLGLSKMQIIFFASLLSLVVFSIVLGQVTSKKKSLNPDPVPQIVNPNNPNDIKDPIVVVKEYETIIIPLDENLDYEIVRKFYEKDDSKENQVKSLIKYNATFRTSQGTSFSLKNKESFSVIACLSGTVKEVKSNPLFGNYCVIESDNNILVYYYGLDNVLVSAGSAVKQGETLGKAITSEVDKELGNHIYVQFKKDNKFINPERVFGKKVNEI